jgi:hypothetical protein
MKVIIFSCHVQINGVFLMKGQLIKPNLFCDVCISGCTVQRIWQVLFLLVCTGVLFKPRGGGRRGRSAYLITIRDRISHGVRKG